MNEVKAVLEDWRETLMRIPGVKAVGRASGSQRIVIYVERKRPEILAVIPAEIEGVPVEVRESGEIRILSLLPPEVIPASVEPLARTGRVRPVVGGVSTGCPQITAGTFGGIAIDNLTGRIVGLSNNHVWLGARWGEQEGYARNPVLQPGVYDHGRFPEDCIGYTSRAVPVELGRENLVDACLCEPIEEVSAEILGVSAVPRTVEPTVGLDVVKSGRTTGVTYGTVTVVDATVDVRGWGTARFTNQVMVEPAMMKGGDSGSLILAEDGGIAGLGFAGSDKVSVFTPASTVQRLLNIRILGAPGLPMLVGWGPTLIGLGGLLISLVW